MTRQVTRTVIITAVALLLLYNVGIQIEPTPGDSISQLIYEWASDWTVIPWLVGLLAGHWFWPLPPVIPKPWRYVFMVDAFLVIVGVNFYYGGVVLPMTAFLIGMICGGVAWGLKND